MKKLIVFLFIIGFTININAQDESIYFDSDQYNIRPSENSKLLNIQKRYAEGSYRILLIGHCDVAGSDAYNIILSEKRVNRIKEYFVNQQVLEQDIQVDFQGEKKAREVAEMYRKVEIFLISKPSPVMEKEIPFLSKKELMEEEEGVVTEAKPVDEVIVLEEKLKPGGKEKEEMSYERFMESVKPKEQIFKFNHEEMNIIEGEQGTMIRIPENAFVFEDGTPARHEIVFKLTEYYSKKEFISERLSTITYGNLLKSAGMIHLEAKAMNDKLRLVEGKDLEILFPKTEENYFTYYGERDEDGIMNWAIDEDYVNEGKKVNLDDFAVTTTKDGEGLELVSRKEAKERNKKAKFKGMDGVFMEVTPEYLDSLQADNEAKRKRVMELWDAREDNRTFLKSKNLGFINCDRLIDGGNAVEIEYMVEIDNEDVDAISAFFVLKNINSVLEIRQQEKNIFYINARMPVGESIQLVITGKDENNELYVFDKVFKLKKKEEGKVMLVKSSYAELSELLD